MTDDKEKRLVLSGNLIVNERKEILLLFRVKHGHWETPGGKVEPEEVRDWDSPRVEELRKTAQRELSEELGKEVKASVEDYFGNIEFIIPDGRKAVVHKFVTRIVAGFPVLSEPENFSKMEYLPIEELENYPLSPDLKILLPEIKKYFLRS